MTAHSHAHRPLLRGPRTKSSTARKSGRSHTILDSLRQLPAYARLVTGLLGDARVSPVDKALCAGAALYIVSPINLIPDFIPIIGEINDLFIVLMALQHLVANAGANVVLDHWHGDIEELEHLDLRRALITAAFFLPRRLRRRLRVLGRAD